MGYNRSDLSGLFEFYRDKLLLETVPFWFPQSFDTEFGGYLLMRDRDGSLLDDDKAIWIQGRALWLLSTLFNTVEPREEWLNGAKLGFEFLVKHGFDRDGRMFFHTTRAGLPVRKRRYFFSETFFCIGAAAYAKASGSSEAADMARKLFGVCINYMTNPSLLEPKFTEYRRLKGIGVPMIMINTAQQLRDTIGDPRCNQLIDQCIDDIERYFVKDDIRCVMEQVATDGEICDHFDGRLLNPGHAIEGSWFILHESIARGGDARLVSLGCRMLDYMWERGWDDEYGGLFYYRDVYNKPVQEYWHDMKFWWPHNEAIIATLLAYFVTGDPKYADWHRKVHSYAYGRFYDPQYGDWFGYLRRDGTLTQTAKGNLFKGPFHLPRQEWYCMQLIKHQLEIK
jgi:N-acylglucosamine 2-epimerase